MNLKTLCLKAIDDGQAIVAGIRCFESFLTAPNGIIPMPKQGEVELDKHAIAIVGYSIPEEVFIFTNSWGKNWGDNGMGKLPFAYFDSGLVLEVAGIGKDPRGKLDRLFGIISKIIRRLLYKREEFFYGGSVGQLNGFRFTVHSDDHGKHFHVIDKGKGIDARFSYPEIRLIAYKQKKSVISSKEKKRIIDFFKKPENLARLKREFEKRS